PHERLHRARATAEHRREVVQRLCEPAACERGEDLARSTGRRTDAVEHPGENRRHRAVHRGLRLPLRLSDDLADLIDDTAVENSLNEADEIGRHAGPPGGCRTLRVRAGAQLARDIRAESVQESGPVRRGKFDVDPPASTVTCMAALADTEWTLESLTHTAGEALRRALVSRSDGGVLSALVEDDLRSALGGLEALHAHLESLVETLLAAQPTPLGL